MHSSYASALGGHGARPTIQHRGKVYTFAALNQRAKSAFERRLIDEAMRTAATAPEPYASRAVDSVVRDAARGVYAFFGEIAQDAVQSPQGMIALTAILLGVSDDEALMLAAETPLEIAAKVDLVILEALPQDVRERTLREREERARKLREQEEKAKAMQQQQEREQADPTSPAQASA